MLKIQINEDYMTAFKEKNQQKKNLLSVIKGDIQTQEKNSGVENLSDELVTKILNKMAKSLKESFVIDNPEISKAAGEELAIVEAYLPKAMSDAEITEKVQSLIANGSTNLGEIMKAFASLPADRKIVSQIYASIK